MPLSPRSSSAMLFAYFVAFCLFSLVCLPAPVEAVYRWKKSVPTGSVPINITNGAVVHINDATLFHPGTVYMVGGHREMWLPTGPEITFFDNVWKLNLDTMVWTLVSVSGSKPSARVYPGSVWSTYDNKMYIYGGMVFDNSYFITDIFSDLWAFDPSTSSFTLVTTTNAGPANRSTHEMFQKGSKLYVTAGIYDRSPFGFPLYTGDIWSLDLSVSPKTWQLANSGSVSPPRRGNFFKFQQNDKLFISGGEIFDPDVEAGFVTLGDTWKFDTDTNTWQDVTPAASNNIDPIRSYTAAIPFGFFKGLLYGGEVPGPQTGCNSVFPANVVADTWVFNILTNKWINQTDNTVGDHPPNLKRHAAVAVSPYKGFWIGGWSFYCTEADQRGQVFSNDVYELRVALF